MPHPVDFNMARANPFGRSSPSQDNIGLRDPAPDPIGGRYRATFKHRFNEAEPPRAVEFIASGPSAAQSEALHRSRPTEVIVDIVLIS